LRKQGVVNRDRISQFPEALLLQILSRLPTKDAIATSVLSKRWRSIWKMVPRLEFNSHYQNLHKFSENVARSLLLHKAPILESLHIKVTDRLEGRSESDIYIGIWSGIAFARHVREFVLHLFFKRPVRFPSSMFNSNNTLETLKLKCSVRLDVPSRFCMKSLRTLHLLSVDFIDNKSIRYLISGCPNLENLVIDRGYPNVVRTFVILAPSLKTLSIKDYGRLEDGGYVITAPSLRYLKIKEFSHCGCCLIDNAPMLVEANIGNVSYLANETILGSLKSAKRLFLDLSPLELVNLEMDTRKAEWSNLLALMLESSPKLQVLKLTDQPLDLNKVGVIGGKWNQPKNVPECLLSHLKKFVWKGYDWERGEEKEVATYILKKASQLKNAIFFTSSIQSKELNRLEERCQMIKELDGVVRASSSCHLEFVEW
ncbi:hypothetical protein CARUB_v10018940mg, partial [Capsella rubella]